MPPGREGAESAVVCRPHPARNSCCFFLDSFSRSGYPLTLEQHNADVENAPRTINRAAATQGITLSLKSRELPPDTACGSIRGGDMWREKCAKIV